MNITRSLAAMALSASALQACTTPPPPAATGEAGVALKRAEAEIPFFNSQRNAVVGWQADGLEGLWIEGPRREWYYAKLNSVCIGLDTAIRLGFDTGPSDRLDRFSRVLVPGESMSCAIVSFTKSDPPPDGKRRALDGGEAKR